MAMGRQRLKKIVSRYQDSDDAVHPFDTPYYYEWWYFDGVFENGYTYTVSCFWRAVVMGSPVPFIAMSVYTPDGNKIDGAGVFDYKDSHASPDKCNVSVGNNYIRQEGSVYKLSMHVQQLGANMGVEMTYSRRVPGWKWSEDGILLDDDTGKQGWVCALPRADVEGKLFIDGKPIPVKGQGYHDHNWGNTLMSNSVNGWVWGRMFHPEYTFVYFCLMPLTSETGINSALYLARNDEPVFASTGIKFTMGKNVLHEETGKSIPTDIIIDGSSEGVDVRCHLNVVKVLEAKTSEPDPGGFVSNYYRRLNTYDARITIDGKSVTITGEAINEHVLLR
jgi:predicted secreted hydrolase